MFLGHFGAGFAGKKFSKSASLGTYFMAAQWIDLLWPILLLLGIEKVKIEPGISNVTPLNFNYYPFTHSLAAAIIWGVIFGVIYFLIKKNAKTSIILGVFVVSHWVLDFLVHIPDLPIFPGSELKVGLGLWNSFTATIILEGLIFGIGIYLYYKVTKTKNKTGTYSLIGLVVFLILIYISNLFGPPPDSVKAIGIVGNAQWLIILWGYWIDKNRMAE
ncbi:MAG: hypothetical protein HND39_06530 [Ignavibacteriota bacterium]|jgi:multisubunit Na+/H+ antiporter MnhC subunit|nr:MAG: hypothetical protein EDM72_03450 [Chlorobiota bacterium]MBE7475926.1 hypothetical protein [Ignavibacteriales bacterium]MBL1123266.1 hypothetical protein [Ignavibacteriota bacterium]MCE7857616.1 hypothetical protein [Ignavibacteria bacterium CHB3]MCZ7615081.1 hypothetical protein [Ignavibacteriaceae bacterium]MEB2297525.1 hypothetical protein [Ignavibacteria bacterium]